MIYQVPTRVDNEKDAALWSLFDRLQKIDENTSTRIAFASSVMYNAHMMSECALFTEELAMLRKTLNIPEPKEEVFTEGVGESRIVSAPEEISMRDDL